MSFGSRTGVYYPRRLTRAEPPKLAATAARANSRDGQPTGHVWQPR